MHLQNENKVTGIDPLILEQRTIAVDGSRPVTNSKVKRTGRDVTSFREVFRTGNRSQSAFLPTLHELQSVVESEQV